MESNKVHKVESNTFDCYQHDPRWELSKEINDEDVKNYLKKLNPDQLNLFKQTCPAFAKLMKE